MVLVLTNVADFLCFMKKSEEKGNQSKNSVILDENELCSVQEAASFLKVTPTTITRWAQAKKFRSFKLGGTRLMISRESLREFVAKSEI